MAKQVKFSLILVVVSLLVVIGCLSLSTISEQIYLPDHDFDQINLLDRAESGLYNPLGYGRCSRGQFRFDWMKHKQGSFKCLKDQDERSDINYIHEPDTWTSHNKSSRIVKGFNIRLGEFPSFVQLFHFDKNKLTPNCGGILLNRYLVLTAWHCVDYLKQVVIAGSIELGKGIKNTVIRSCRSNKWTHELLYAYDWAILELKNNYKYTENIQPACINLDFKHAKNMTCVTIGHGLAKPNTTMIKPLRGAVMTNSECDTGDEFGMLCTKSVDGVSFICNGDSGGPLYCFENCSGKPRMYVVGLTKGSIPGCFPYNVARFTSILAHRVEISTLIQEFVSQRKAREPGSLPDPKKPPGGFFCLDK